VDDETDVLEKWGGGCVARYVYMYVWRVEGGRWKVEGGIMLVV
jgi:hypothetical protein